MRVPGLDAPDVRVDGRPIGPLRWPETPLLSVPTLAVRSATLRRSSPIDGPLSATGGALLDLRLHSASLDSAISAVRLTRASYATFTEEIVFRRRVGSRLLFSGFYGDEKTAGRDLWRGQFSETIGLRASHPYRGGSLEWGYDAARYRANLLASKRQLWDRRGGGVRWEGRFPAGHSLEADFSWSHQRGGWWTARGLSERLSNGTRGRFVTRFDSTAFPMSAAVEIDGTRTRFRRFDGERRLLRDLSYGGAVGFERRLGGSDLAVAVGGVRVAPLAPAPILHAELAGRLGERTGWSLHAGRNVRNRTLPRLPTDGEAWVRQGIGLAVEDSDETAESSSRAGGAIRADVGRQRFVLGIEGCLRERGLALDEAEITLLGIDRQSEIPDGAMRGSRSFASPSCEIYLVLPGSISLRAAGWTNFAEEGWRSHMALPAAEGNGEACWSGTLFKGDLDLDLSLAWRFRDRIATPYGILAPGARADGRILGRIGPAEVFFVLANITDTVATSLSYDGRFMFMPRRHFYAGVTWHFID